MAEKLPINVLDLLRHRVVESERIEYKTGWNPDPIIRTLCAFANDFENLSGGYIIIGQDCDVDGRPLFPPVGVPDEEIDKIQQELLAYCQSIQPHYFPTFCVEKVEGRNVIILWAPGGLARPYRAPASVTAKHKTWHHYIRRYSSTVEAKGEIERELISLTASIPFDDRFVHQARPADLSPFLMQAFLYQANSALAEEATSVPVETLGRQMNVLGGPTESPWPKNVGLLFFNETPDKFVPYTQIDVVWFPDGAGGDRFEERIFKGPIPRMVRGALDYIKDKLLFETVIKQPQKAEALRFWNFPYVAIEEAVVNAVYHRSYEEREPIEVRVDPDEIAIVSYPGPDRSIRLADLQEGKAVTRRYRNRRIGEFLKELEMTEGRGTGIPKILRAMKNNGSPPPRFETDDDRLGFAVRLPRHPLAGGQASTTELPPSKHRPSTGPVPTQHRPSTDPVSYEIASLLRALQGEMSRQEILEALTIKHKGHFREVYLKPALAASLVEMTRPDTPNSSKQRYRLTERGHQWLREHAEAGK